MIAAHAVYFFHNDSNFFLTQVEHFGNTVAFTTFLMVSAATAEIAYFSKTNMWDERKKRLRKRVAILLFGYFSLAFTVFFANIVSTYGFERIRLIFDILTLRNLASFAEFFIPFIAFPLIISTAPRFFRKVTKSVWSAIIFGLTVYFLGMFFYQLPVPGFLIPWKGLLVGAEGYYRFPVMQYFPLYLLGMVWGSKLLKTGQLKHQREIVRSVMISAGVAIIIAFVGLSVTGSTIAEITKRWPPSIPFMLLGILFASTLAYVLYLTNQLKKLPLLRDGALVLGQNALGMALTHVFLLQIYTLSGGLRTGSVFIYLISLFMLLTLSVALSAVIPFNFRLTLSLERGLCREHELEQTALVRFEEEAVQGIKKEIKWLDKYFFIGRWRGKSPQKIIAKRHILGASLLFGLAAFVVIPPFAQEYQIRKAESIGIKWDGNTYGWRQKIKIKNAENLAEFPEKSIVSWQFNHAELVLTKKSYFDGRDIMIRYWDGENYQTVKYWFISPPNQSSTVIAIELINRIKPGETNDKYYLYYGNNFAKSTMQLGSPTKLLDLKSIIVTEKEEKHPRLLTIDRRWSILTDDPKVPTSIRIALQTTEKYSANEVTFTVAETKKNGMLTKTGDNQWEGVIDIKDMETGEYHLEATINDGESEIDTSTTGFFVSEPLYIAWTQDWEGYDVPDNYLSAISQVARDHNITMTHFWNPRLTITDTVPQNRKDVLLSWMKNRQSVFGERAHLHLHMFKDYVAACGVEPKPYPNWGDSGDGYGSLTTNYTTEEMTKMIKRGIETMVTSDLGAPKIFRAGGWFASEETLQAVENSGLLADSSGRTAYKFYQQTGPWNLSETQQPYFPSKKDQNRSGQPALDILEIPNNGADSYWFSTEEMKKRFKANYSGGVLNHPRQITYLSHPHWFNKSEQAKIEGVFSYIDNYTYDNDNGPAIYVTLDEIYRVWTKR